MAVLGAAVGGVFCANPRGASAVVGFGRRERVFLREKMKLAQIPGRWVFEGEEARSG